MWFRKGKAVPSPPSGPQFAPSHAPLIVAKFHRTVRHGLLRSLPATPADGRLPRPAFPWRDRKGGPPLGSRADVGATGQISGGSSVGNRRPLRQHETLDARHRIGGLIPGPVYALWFHPPSWRVVPVFGFPTAPWTRRAPPPAGPNPHRGRPVPSWLATSAAGQATRAICSESLLSEAMLSARSAVGSAGPRYSVDRLGPSSQRTSAKMPFSRRKTPLPMTTYEWREGLTRAFCPAIPP